MKRITSNRKFRRTERGQTLIVIALAFIGLLGFVSLTVDLGIVLATMGNIRRAVDAASLAAAAQYREGRTFAEMEAIAQEVMALNGIDTSNITVSTCASQGGVDPVLCTTPRRKLVRVTVQADVPLAFMSLLGINHISLSGEAIGEAAAMDVVLVIDISESMTSDFPIGDPQNRRDPVVCNDLDPGGAEDGIPGECHPFEEVKAAAANFAMRILNQADPTMEEDRLAIVTLSNGWEAGHFRGTDYQPDDQPPQWINNRNTALNLINNLEVYEPVDCPEGYPGVPSDQYGSCRLVDPDDGDFLGVYCPRYENPDIGDPSSCTTTNIGGGLLLAGNMYALDTRTSALWVVVLLTDGAANASASAPPDNQFGYCPGEAGEPTWLPPFCRDDLVRTRHFEIGDPDYDADDYARAMGDFVGCLPNDPAPSCHVPAEGGQGAVVFTIGLGNLVLSPDAEGVPFGAALLRHIAAAGDDGDPATDLCEDQPPDDWCGNYYFSPTGDELDLVFEDIASRIFTRLMR